MSSDRLDRINSPSNVPNERRAELENNELFHKKRRKHRRDNTINWCYIGFIIICMCVVGAVVVIKALHMLLPSNRCWLTKDQLANLNDFFVDGSIGALMVGVLKSKVLQEIED